MATSLRASTISAVNIKREKEARKRADKKERAQKTKKSKSETKEKEPLDEKHMSKSADIASMTTTDTETEDSSGYGADNDIEELLPVPLTSNALEQHTTETTSTTNTAPRPPTQKKRSLASSSSSLPSILEQPEVNIQELQCLFIRGLHMEMFWHNGIPIEWPKGRELWMDYVPYLPLHSCLILS